MPPDTVVETTSYAPVPGAVSKDPEMLSSRFDAVAALPPDGETASLVETTSLDPEAAPAWSRKKTVAPPRAKAGDDDRRICNNCGTVSGKARCVRCGSPTRTFAP
jgi:hypothetical protein